MCANHFESDCFTNLGQYDAGLSTRLALKGGSVSSIRRNTADEENVKCKKYFFKEIVVFASFAHFVWGCHTRLAQGSPDIKWVDHNVAIQVINKGLFT